MSWENKVRSRIKTGNIYRMSNIGKVKVVGTISQFGGRGSGGALFVKCMIIENTSGKDMYEPGTFHELNAEFMF